MDLQANKVDEVVLPLSNKRIGADEWNQLAASCMAFITAAGLTPDAADNEQFLNAFKAIAATLELVGANTNLSNLTATGEGHFANPNLSNVTSTGKSTVTGWVTPDYSQGTSFTLDSNTSYTALKDGFVFIYTSRGEDLQSNVKINGVQVGYSQAYYGNMQYFFPVSVGDVISTDYNSISNALFCPLKGAI